MPEYTLAAGGARPDPADVFDGYGATLFPAGDGDCLRTNDGDTSWAEFEPTSVYSAGFFMENGVRWTSDPPPSGTYTVTRAQIFARVKQRIVTGTGPGLLQMGWSTESGSHWGAVWPALGSAPEAPVGAYAVVGGDVDPAPLMLYGGHDLSTVEFYVGWFGAPSGSVLRVTQAWVVLTTLEPSGAGELTLRGRVDAGANGDPTVDLTSSMLVQLRSAVSVLPVVSTDPDPLP